MLSAEFVATWSPRLLAVLRIVAALIFLAHGTQKLLGFPESPRPMTVELFSLIWLSAVLELVCGAMMLVGFQTRLAAFVASGEMAFAYFLAHAPRSVFPVNNNGDAAILYCFVFLYLAVAGGGAWTLDSRRSQTA